MYVPILLATSPLAATRSVPTMTASISPHFIKCPAMLSVISVTGMFSCTISQAVSLAPCKNGRVSSANTEIFLPASTAERITPSAVP